MSTLSFHFHGYQPGDVVRWLEPDPLRPQTFEERRSPVAHRIGADRIGGRNWTDAVLRTYGRMEAVLEEASGAASVDVEPQTLVWLLERDPAAYRGIFAAWERGAAGFVMTPPFHAILPHLHRLERQVLFDLMIDFYSPLLPKLGGQPIGLWLPETAASRETIESLRESARQAELEDDTVADALGALYVVADARQFDPPAPDGAWRRIDLHERLLAAGRDPSLSGEFAFGASSAADFAASVRNRKSGSVLVASDLESLLSNPEQAERFGSIVRSLREGGVQVASPVPPRDAPISEIVDFSSWSDYDEFVVRGHTSDTRWTGLRRADGVVVSRPHRGRAVSQLWKHAFTLAMERIETAIRRRALHLLKGAGVGRRSMALRRLAVAYGRHLFRSHFVAQGNDDSRTGFERAADEMFGGRIDVELAGLLGRGYLFMLMGSRSDPRFWDHPDTRVTFQSVVLLVQALRDLAEASVRAKDRDRAAALRRLLQATFLEFSEWYGRGEFVSLQGAQGWETRDAAWYASLASEIPERSTLDVVRRAALFALSAGREWPGLDPLVRAEGAVADAGHIVGEAHGLWENPAWCEHRPG